MVSKLYIYNEKIIQCLLNIIMPQYYKKNKTSRCQGEEKIFTQRNGISGPVTKHFTFVFDTGFCVYGNNTISAFWELVSHSPTGCACEGYECVCGECWCAHVYITICTCMRRTEETLTIILWRLSTFFFFKFWSRVSLWPQTYWVG